MQHHKFPADFYEHLKNHNHTGIKGGKERTTFLDIWMVNVDGRIFARSWGKSERSWFTTMLKEKTGEIKYGEKIIAITSQPCKDPVLNSKINEAYLQRYTTPENVPYAVGISQPEYADYTMEYIYIEG